MSVLPDGAGHPLGGANLHGPAQRLMPLESLPWAADRLPREGREGARLD